MLSTSSPTFKQDLKIAREARGFTATKLSDAVNISYGMIARYESFTRKDKVLPNAETLKKINTVLFPAPVEQSEEGKAESLPLDVLIKAIKKRGAKEIVF